jgi:uncharacterized protein (UPF0332 family)
MQLFRNEFLDNSFTARAAENLFSAQQLFEAGCYNASANRAYYAAFHAALAVLSAKKLPTNTDHEKVQANFNGILINQQKVFPMRIKRYLSDMQNVRNDADYKQGISKRTAKEQITMGHEFVTLLLLEIQQ